MTGQAEYDALLKRLDSYQSTDPLLVLRGLSVAKDITDPEMRGVRSKALQAMMSDLWEALDLCDYPYEVVIRKSGAFARLYGVLMDVRHTPFYLKASGPEAFEGQHTVVASLERLGLSVETALDVGANWGEVTLPLAKAFPDARILAVEPVSSNLKILQRNIDEQDFPTAHIELIKMAVSDKSETGYIQAGASTANRLSKSGLHQNSEAVVCKPLDVLFAEQDIETADFVKIDIEGMEPKLAGSIATLGNRVQAYLIEFSQFSPFEDYMGLLDTLLAQGYLCLDSQARTTFASRGDVAQHVQTAFKESSIAVTNLWFCLRT